MACLLNFTPEQRQELQDPELITLVEEVRGGGEQQQPGAAA